MAVILAYALSPIIRDEYKSWRDSKELLWRDDWQIKQNNKREQAVNSRSEPKTFITKVPGGTLEAKIGLKVIAFNKVAFRVLIEPFSEDELRTLVGDRQVGDDLVFLHLQDSDQFRLESIKFSSSESARKLNDQGKMSGLIFEATKDLDFSTFDKIHDIKLSIHNYRPDPK